MKTVKEVRGMKMHGQRAQPTVQFRDMHGIQVTKHGVQISYGPPIPKLKGKVSPLI